MVTADTGTLRQKMLAGYLAVLLIMRSSKLITSPEMTGEVSATTTNPTGATTTTTPSMSRRTRALMKREHPELQSTYSCSAVVAGASVLPGAVVQGCTTTSKSGVIARTTVEVLTSLNSRHQRHRQEKEFGNALKRDAVSGGTAAKFRAALIRKMEAPPLYPQVRGGGALRNEPAQPP